jgi:protein transport protein SEC23
LDITSPTSKPSSSSFFLQFQTLFKHTSGQTRLRITTVSRRYSNDSNIDFAMGFDQEAACVGMARLSLDRSEKEEPLEVLKWYFIRERRIIY